MARPSEARVMFAVVATTLSAEAIPLTPIESWILRSWWGLDRDWRPDQSDPRSAVAIHTAEAWLTLKLEWYVIGVLAGKFSNPFVADRREEALRAVV